MSEWMPEPLSPAQRRGWKIAIFAILIGIVGLVIHLIQEDKHEKSHSAQENERQTPHSAQENERQTPRPPSFIYAQTIGIYQQALDRCWHIDQRDPDPTNPTPNCDKASAIRAYLIQHGVKFNGAFVAYDD